MKTLLFAVNILYAVWESSKQAASSEDDKEMKKSEKIFSKGNNKQRPLNARNILLLNYL